MSKVVLGKGLGALIPTDEKKAAEDKQFKIVSLESLAPNPMQPRHDFDDEGLMKLADSLKMNGVMQPLVVRHNGSGYTIIAGERRFRAATLAGLKEVPVVMMENITDARMLELALVENLLREDLNPMEMAEAYHRLIVECNLTQNQLASQVGRSRAAVANVMRLNSLPEAIKKMVRENKITEGHARAILALNSEVEMLSLANRIVDETMSVRQAEQFRYKIKKRRLIPKRKIPFLMETETFLKRLLGTSVKIIPGLKRGRIEIEYYKDEDLERLLELFKKIQN